MGQPDRDAEVSPAPAERATLADILTHGDTFKYDYVFGEDWQHTVMLLSREAAQPDMRYPNLISAEGRCPPADIGGPIGYETYLRSIADPNSGDHEDMLDFDAPDFDPHVVDAATLRQNFGGSHALYRPQAPRGGAELNRMQFGVQFFPDVRPRKSAAEYFAESLDIAEEADRLGYSHPHRRALFPLLRRLQPQSDRLSRSGGAAHEAGAAGHRRGAAGLQPPAEAGRRDRDARRDRRGRLDVGFARAFLPHEFRRFGRSPDESVARFREGIEQVDLLLARENVTHRGRFHTIENTTSLPRPTQQPRPKFYVAALNTPNSFEFAGRDGLFVMAIPSGRCSDLLPIYRKAWRDAGHPGDGEVMIAFHMFCHEDAKLAREIPRRQFEDYFAALFESAGEWTQGTSSIDYKGV